MATVKHYLVLGLVVVVTMFIVKRISFLNNLVNGA